MPLSSPQPATIVPPGPDIPRRAKARQRRKYPPPPDLVKIITVGSSPNASPEEFEAALRDVRGTPGTEKEYAEAEEVCAKYRQGLEDAWRNAALPLDTVWGEWVVKRRAERPKARVNAIQSYIAVLAHKAIMRFHMTGDPRPLAAALATLQSPEALAPLNSESIARLRELLDARSKPLRRGKPGGVAPRWRMANYVAAFLVELMKEDYRRMHGLEGVKATETERLIDCVVDHLQTWETTKRSGWLDDEPLQKDRIINILRQARSRRLFIRAATKRSNFTLVQDFSNWSNWEARVQTKGTRAWCPIRSARERSKH